MSGRYNEAAIALLADWFHDGNEDRCDCIRGLSGPLLCHEWAENILDALNVGGFPVAVASRRQP